MSETRNAGRFRTIVTITTAVITLGLCGGAFAIKLFEFVHTFQGQSDGIFAITPIANYGLATLGFLCLLIWAAVNGMFHDIEQPKFTMLEQEQQLDAKKLESTAARR